MTLELGEARHRDLARCVSADNIAAKPDHTGKHRIGVACYFRIKLQNLFQIIFVGHGIEPAAVVISLILAISYIPPAKEIFPGLFRIRSSRKIALPEACYPLVRSALSLTGKKVTDAL